MGRAHVVAIPYPAQGHVIPMMELAQCLANNSIRVTFVNTESNHVRVLEALPETDNLHELINLVSVSDGRQSWEDRMDFATEIEELSKRMPGELEALIESINTTQSDVVTCIITDFFMAWITQANENFHVNKATFMPAAAALLALMSSTEKLVDDGVIDSNGTPLKSQSILLSPSMPEMSPNHFAWVCLPDLAARRVVYQSIIENNKSVNLSQRLICNSSHELEAGALSFMKDCWPIGPLLASHRLGKQTGYFWPENPMCLSWLDQQPANSVIYIAFGSFTVFDAYQFQELALGLELTNRPFLWVVRQDITKDIEDAYPVGFNAKVTNRGKMVDWAPQQQVLSHPSVACFMSHCGWNSTVESVSNGVPILCWPYFADQLLNRTYIVDHWGVGLSRNIKRCKEGSYIAFGSYTIFNVAQFQELALGLELTNRSFLRVVKQDTTQQINNACPVGFKERMTNRWKIVEGAPQQSTGLKPLFHFQLPQPLWLEFQY